MLIKARLHGHQFDLLTLAELFREGDPAVATDHEGYCLSFTAPDGLLDDGARLSDAASVLLRRANGVARTLSSDFRPVGLTGRFSDGTGRQHQVVLADTAEVRARANPVTVSMGGEQPPPPPAPGPGYVQLAHTHPDVAEVLDILGNADPAPDWSDLYRSTRSCSTTCPGSTSAAGSPRTRSVPSLPPPIGRRSAATLPVMLV
jgi:hypothetical protein